MKFVALIGSRREGSFNRKVFEYYRDMAKGRVEIEEGVQEGLPPYDDDLRQTAPPQVALNLAEQIRKSDGVIFFSPEYNYSVPGTLKNTIDWMSKLPDHPFAGKPVSIVSASPGKLGGARMQYHLRQIGVFLDMRFLNKPEVMISEVKKKFDDEGNLVDEATKSFLAAHFEAFVQHARSR